MQVVHETEVLEAAAKGGAAKFWQGFVVVDNGVYYTQTRYWHTKADGTSSIVQESAPYEVATTNVGKANERGGMAQALFNITSDYQKQVDKGYHLRGAASEVLPLPMLANGYKKGGFGKLVAPVYAQPKIDGCRAVGDGEKYWSRLGKVFAPEIVEHLLVNVGEELPDGELRLPAGYSFQQTMQAVKKFRPELTPLLEYWVFDLIDADCLFDVRNTRRTQLLGRISNPRIISVPTLLVLDETQLFALHAAFCQEGFEGTIIRDNSATYEIGHRSRSLLKHKDFLDAEFPIIGAREGEGKEKGCIIFMCEAPNGSFFEVRPRGTVEYRQEMWQRRAELVGKQLTLRYQELTTAGIPRFPVGIAVREDFDR